MSSRRTLVLQYDPYGSVGRGSLIGAAVHSITLQEQEEDPLVSNNVPADERDKVAFRQAEMETIEKVIGLIERSSAKRVAEGFSELNFTVGVLNCFLVCIVFSRYPEHFWLLYLVESVYAVPQVVLFNWRANPLCQILYFFDYCWVMNLLAYATLLSLSFFTAAFSLETRRQLFAAAVGTGTGTLTGASLVLPFVALLFHDLRTMTAVLIHLLPTMMIYTFMWHRTAIQQAWPAVFPFHYDYDEIPFYPGDRPGLFLPGTGLGSVAGNAVALYALWWVLYVIWMVFLGGINLPRKDRPKPPTYDTVFHSTVRNGLVVLVGKLLWRRPVRVSLRQQETDHYELRDFFVYMTAHAILAYFGGTLLLANICCKSQRAHLVVIAITTAVAVYRGAERYTYYATSMYEQSIRTEFKDILDEQPIEATGKKTH